MSKRFLVGIAPLVTIAALSAPPPGSAERLGPPHAHQSGRTTALSPSLAAAASARIGASERRFGAVRRAPSLLTEGAGIDGAFTASGVSLRVTQGTLDLSFVAVERGRRVEPVGAVAPSAAANRIAYRHGPVSEFYANGPYGLEQGFSLSQRPQGGAGPLVLVLGLAGSLTPKQAGSEVLFRTRAGATALRYGELNVLDATGRRLSAHMQIHNGSLQLLIDDSHARYPLRIDPFITPGSKLTAPTEGSGAGEELGGGEVGASVALSASGRTALVGAPNDDSGVGGVGAAYVFTRTGSTWSFKEKLTPKNETGNDQQDFGFDVALSADGSTALIGDPHDNGTVGAAWWFQLSGAKYEEQQKITAESGEVGDAEFGGPLSLSADGKTALIGGSYDNSFTGKAWVFKLEGQWKQQNIITPNNEIGRGEFGQALALSADGTTALITAVHDGSTLAGAAWWFKYSSTTKEWEQKQKFTPATESDGESEFGRTLALSANGTTALFGGVVDEGTSHTRFAGAAWVYSFNSAKAQWEEQQKLTGGGSGEIGEGEFGEGVALSENGNLALIGGRDDNGNDGAAWVFTRTGSTWNPVASQELRGNGEIGEGHFGYSPALSRAGTIAMIGGPTDNGNLGAVWAFNLSGPHYYGNLVELEEGKKVPYVSYGHLALTSSLEASTTECANVVAGWVENPVGGGPGREEIEGWSASECHNTECETAGGKIGVLLENENAPGPALQLHWPGVLEETQVGVFRLNSTDVSVYVHCQDSYSPPMVEAGTRTTSEVNLGEALCTTTPPGSLTPQEISGTAIGKPAKTKFGGPEGGLWECGPAGKGEATGSLATLLYNPENNEPITLEFKRE